MFSMGKRIMGWGIESMMVMTMMQVQNHLEKAFDFKSKFSGRLLKLKNKLKELLNLHVEHIM